jgi:hypothetical protein
MPHWNAVSTLAIETSHAGAETGLHLYGVVGRALVVSTHCPLAYPYTDWINASKKREFKALEGPATRSEINVTLKKQCILCMSTHVPMLFLAKHWKNTYNLYNAVCVNHEGNN